MCRLSGLGFSPGGFFLVRLLFFGIFWAVGPESKDASHESTILRQKL